MLGFFSLLNLWTWDMIDEAASQGQKQFNFFFFTKLPNASHASIFIVKSRMSTSISFSC